MSDSTIVENKPFINVTPLIDVLLVVLIIFMVAAPLRPHSFAAKLPSEPDSTVPLPAHIDTLVVTIEPDRTLKLNSLTDMGTVDDPGKLSTRLASLFQERKKNHVYRDSMLTRTDVPEDYRIEKTVFIKSFATTSLWSPRRSKKFPLKTHLISAGCRMPPKFPWRDCHQAVIF